MSSVTIGIDLGTTNSCVAIYRNGQVEIIQNKHRSYTTPSWVCFSDNGVLIGEDAINESHMYVKNTIYEVKRLMGEKYHHAKVQSDIRRVPYEIINCNGIPKIKITTSDQEKEYFPEEISAYILQELKLLAEKYLDQEDIYRVVITVPAYFNDHQRQATKNAAEIAKFKRINIINEPTAAALAYNYHNPKNYKRNILVYDFGGGTFDVSIVSISKGKCEVKATKGDSHLGGTDIDTNLVNFVKNDFKRQYNQDIPEDETITRRLRSRCENVKKKLSANVASVDLELSNLSGHEYHCEITKKQFEDMNMNLFDRTIRIVDECLKSSSLKKEDIDAVVLVGGSSRIPKVQQMLEELFGHEKISKGVNPDEAVAYGAAIHAFHLLGDKCEIEDVCSLSLGTQVGIEKKYSIIIQNNTAIPTERIGHYETASHYQEAVDIYVYQGEEPMAKDNFLLGEFTLTNLRKAPAGQVKIDVCFALDLEGILNVTAFEVDANNKKSIKIDIKSKGLTPEKIAERMKELEIAHQNEIKRRLFFDDKYKLDKLCQDIIVGLSEQENAEGQDLNDILKKCKEVETWLLRTTIKDHDEVRAKRKELENINEKYLSRK